MSRSCWVVALRSFRRPSLGDHSYVAYLSVENVDDYHARSISEQAEVLKAPTDEPWGRREMGLRSPDGHRFMLGERTPQLSD